MKAEKQMKVYIAGKITGLEKPDFLKKFYDSSKALRDQGHLTMSPATLALNEGFSHEDYLHVCYAMIDVCDAVFLQKDWRDSEGARRELYYAKAVKKQIIFEEFEEQEGRES